MTEQKRYFVYVDRTNVGVPFYVGYGNSARVKQLCRRNAKYKNVVNKHGQKREVILSSYDIEFAKDTEISLIQQLRTFIEMSKLGCNLTLGGEGTVGFTCSDEQKQKISIANTGRIHTDIAKQNMSLAAKGKKKSLSHVAAISAGKKGKTPKTSLRKPLSENTKKKQSLAMIGRKQFKEICLKKSLATKGISKSKTAVQNYIEGRRRTRNKEFVERLGSEFQWKDPLILRGHAVMKFGHQGNDVY